ncbi:TetR/AcrR family transcriptional regulator [Gallaecimonas pentaromativorans]|uniref:TetR family transcriptional regulator n=1 Tax=Gallaecimonas pentaromativorans TaxID=584787 RepID=A0A3N1PMQ9_9GAMM|nr:TetR/AcrR family transcriptional regulator [Gallaecimonas pentaromativorans]ROQ25806.1 TetR family transcriptional regulator [Gallaecimonas pentaromativorans]
MSTALSPKAAEIAQHARTLLEAGGYNSFSYADISARVNISKASIHHHFPSKAELVRVVVARYREEARAGMAALDTQLADPLAELKAYLGYWVNCIEGQVSSFCLCAMLGTELPALPDDIALEIRDHFSDLAAWLASLLEKGSQSGQLRLTQAPALEAEVFMATVHGAMMSARVAQDPKLFQSITALLIEKLAA